MQDDERDRKYKLPSFSLLSSCMDMSKQMDNEEHDEAQSGGFSLWVKNP
jgi:hypothetical protein